MMYETGKILKNVPVPEKTQKFGRDRKWPVLEVGECMFFEDPKEALSFKTSQIAYHKHRFEKLGEIKWVRGMFRQRTLDGQIGIWRIK